MKDQLVSKVTLGSDPELFVCTKDAKFIPSLDLVFGTKENPRPMLVPGFFVQEDNVLLEFNIPPAHDKKEFVDSLISGLDQIKKMLPGDGDLSVMVKSSHKFEEEQLLDPRANQFGCDPDYNAWTKGFNPRPDVPLDGLRTAGGHIHIGYGDVRKDTNRKIVKAMDFFLGVPSIVLDKDTDRRRLYGKAGAYRNKPYGVEYRTLSSFWLSSPDLMAWTYDQTMKAIDFVNKGANVPNEVVVIDTINKSDEKMAVQLCKEYNITEII